MFFCFNFSNSYAETKESEAVILLKLRVNQDLLNLVATFENVEFFTEIFKNENGAMKHFLAVLKYSARYFSEYIRRHLLFPYDADADFDGTSDAEKVKEGLKVNKHIFIYIRGFVYHPQISAIGAMGELAKMLEDFIECLETFANCSED